MTKQISYGIILYDSTTQKIFLSHVTGQRHFDIPKGGGELTELPLESALRELREETDISLSENVLCNITEHGLTQYTKKKDLYLFSLDIPEKLINPKSCKCNSFFETEDGAQLPEVDSFNWYQFDEALKLVIPNMKNVLLNLQNNLFNTSVPQFENDFNY